MKFTANIGVLKSGLKPVIEVATKSVASDSEDAYRVTLEAKDGNIIASANGGRLSISLSIDNVIDPKFEYTCQEEGEVTVNAIDLAKNLESFPPKYNANFSGGKDFVIANSVDKDEFQAQPIFPDPIKKQVIGKDTTNQITVSRDIFIDGFQKILFAAGYKKTMPQYLYWRITSKKDFLRFASGTGSRFAMLTFEGNDFVESDGIVELLLPKDQSQVAVSVLSGIEDEKIKIRKIDRTKNTPDQIVFETNQFKLLLVGFDASTRWPEIEKILENKPTCRLTTKHEGWEYATKGLLATFNEEMKSEHETHESDIEINLSDQFLVLTTKQSMRASRKVPISDVLQKDEDSNGLTIHCSTRYLRDIYENSNKDDKIEMLFVDNKNPVVVEMPERLGGRNLKEKLVMFFASLSK